MSGILSAGFSVAGAADAWPGRAGRLRDLGIGAHTQAEMRAGPSVVIIGDGGLEGRWEKQASS